MYGYDGNMTALEFAELVGFRSMSESVQQQLIQDGYYTVDGHRVFTQEEANMIDIRTTLRRKKL